MNFKNLFLVCVFSIALFAHSAYADVFEVDEMMYPSLFISKTIHYSDLANGGVFTIYSADTTLAQYRIMTVVSSAQDSVDFMNGDRNISIGTSAEEKWVIPESGLIICGGTSLTTDSSTGSSIGIHPTPYQLAFSMTSPGLDITARYSGGTADYLSGSITISVYLFQSRQ